MLFASMVVVCMFRSLCLLFRLKLIYQKCWCLLGEFGCVGVGSL